ncbi:MAG: sigma 54-interacting transcriptional regulator [Candidatus Marinimicrobia bacterium]|nr:sigma 54-interacting transcriptional regulator [Candidatus Neomarinimicrobiota bacterium]
MLDIKIGVVSTDHETSKIIQELADKMHLDILLKEGILEEGVVHARQLEREGVDIIISRGITGKKIKKKISLPTVIIEITAFDILKALNSAKSLGSKIAFLGNRKDIGPEFDSITKILGIEVECYPYNNTQEMDEQVTKILNSHVDVIVSTGLCIFEIAKKSGMNAILVKSGYEAIYNSLKRAIELIHDIRRTQEFSQKFRSVLESTNDGIFILDKDKRISFVNPAAEKLLNINAHKILGHKADEVNHNSFLTPILNNKKQEIIKKIGEKQFWLNTVPIRIKNKEQGLVIMFQSADRIQVLEQRFRRELLKKRLVAKHTFNDIVGKSELLKNTIERAKKFATTDATVLITGESGTGKELFAHSIHNESNRSKGPFVAVNCAALPENLLESELFGYEEGAFTGAKKGGKIGLFELAHGGTIFLDEIAEVSLQVQARLLRALQECEIMRLGSDRVIPVDVRIIAATNKDLSAAVQQGKFRNDLYYRLEVLDLEIPPLRKRKDDIEVLANYFKDILSHQISKNVPDLTPTAIEQLKKYDWPGNVRELRNVIEKYVLLIEDNQNCDDLIIKLINEKILKSFNIKADDSEHITIKIGKWEDMEQQILEYLKSKGTSIKDLTKILGTSRTTIWRKLKNSGKKSLAK